MRISRSIIGLRMLTVGCVVVAGALSACSSTTRSAAEAESSAATCAEGGPCQVGDTGPGGGTVFYVAPQRSSWGQVLEVAPATWSGAQDPEAPWCATSAARTRAGTRLGVGEGRANSAAVASACGADSAAGAAQAYRGGNRDDWFLPSKDELALLYQQRASVDGLAPTLYWTSSEAGGSQDDPINAWYQRFDTGSQYEERKVYRYRVRPIRAF